MRKYEIFWQAKKRAKVQSHELLQPDNNSVWKYAKDNYPIVKEIIDLETGNEVREPVFCSEEGCNWSGSEEHLEKHTEVVHPESED